MCASKNSSEKVTIDSFELIRKIGVGSYGSVFLSKKISGDHFNEPFALKVLTKHSLLSSSAAVRSGQTERCILQKHKSPFIVNLHYTFGDSLYVYFCLEYLAGGDFYTFLEIKKTLKEDEIAFYSAEIALALDHLHKLRIIYRDLKPSNIMIDHRGNVKLVDFGLSKILKPGCVFASSRCGTCEFMSPEMVLNKPYSYSADWWSFGILLYDMFYLGTPFFDNRKAYVYENIKRKPLPMPDAGSIELKTLIISLLNRNQARRLCFERGIEDLRQHEFYANINFDKLLKGEIQNPWFNMTFNGKFDFSHFDKRNINSNVLLPAASDEFECADVFGDFEYVAPLKLTAGSDESIHCKSGVSSLTGNTESVNETVLDPLNEEDESVYIDAKSELDNDDENQLNVNMDKLEIRDKIDDNSSDTV